MNSKLAAVALGLLCAAATARDPFSPLTLARCTQQAPELSQWRLQGIIGRPGDYHGWLYSPQGQNVRVTPDSVLPIYPWQVSEISALALHLHTGQPCARQQFSWRLQGRLYEKNDDRDAAAVQPIRAQQ